MQRLSRDNTSLATYTDGHRPSPAVEELASFSPVFVCLCSSVSSFKRPLSSPTQMRKVSMLLQRRMFGLPARHAALPKIVLVVQTQFFQAFLGHARQFHLQFSGSCRIRAPPGDILPSASRDLDHLIVRPTARIDIFVAEPHSHIVNHLGQLKSLQTPKTAMLWNQFLTPRPRMSVSVRVLSIHHVFSLTQ